MTKWLAYDLATLARSLSTLINTALASDGARQTRGPNGVGR
jgi:hypothetical protein